MRSFRFAIVWLFLIAGFFAAAADVVVFIWLQVAYKPVELDGSLPGQSTAAGDVPATLRDTRAHAAPTAPRHAYRISGEVHASSVVAATGPMKAAPMRAELMTPIAPPPARWAMRATTIGKTGATHST